MAQDNPKFAFSRKAGLRQLKAGSPFDMLVIGGGATGVGIAVDAASRGYRTALCEQHDFGKGTSSRSTKLIHGGVRYLQQGNITLVRDALRERSLLLTLAPHVVYPLPTIVPIYKRFEGPYYWLGLKAYDLLAGCLSQIRRGGRLRRSKWLSKTDTIAALPTLNTTGLRGGVRYFDTGFDDTRLLINLVQTAIEQGAVCVNYLRVCEFKRAGGKITGVVANDEISGEQIEIDSRVVINAAGPFSDDVRRLDDPGATANIAPSQGVHLVLNRDFLPGDSALLVPKTSDDRVMFAIPWHGHTLIGTTDTPRDDTPLEPQSLPGEIEFLLSTAAGYLARRPVRSDILSVFAGLRPLVRSGAGRKTSQLSRDHHLQVDDSGLVSILGGKWTTYRKMAADSVERASQVAGLPTATCRTAELPVHGATDPAAEDRLHFYGSDAPAIGRLQTERTEYGELLDGELPYTVAEAVWAIRNELAQTVEDVLSRRLRALLLNARAAIRAAPRVAELLAEEHGHDNKWRKEEIARFETVARGYLADT